MFKKYDSKNSIVLKSILSLGIIYGGTFGIYPKADASTQNSSSVQDKQLQKLKKYQIIQKKLWLKNFTIDTARIQ